MHRLFLLLSLLVATACSRDPAAPASTAVVSSDLDHFWEAYDSITATTDTSEQLRLLNTLFIDRASPGQEALFAVRNYTPVEYVHYIGQYPKFYASIRANQEKYRGVIDAIDGYLPKLKVLYPEATPAKVYFGMGNLRTSGTTIDSTVLFGAEIAFGDRTTDVSELPAALDNIKEHFQTDPVKEIDFLALHEYVHTQQVESLGVGLLATCLREGSAEFIAELASGKASTTPAIPYGRANEAAVFAAFERQLFNQQVGYWLWTSAENPFGTRDLGYFIGYTLARHYYDRATDSTTAVRELIELDYGDQGAVEDFVESIGYFDRSVEALRTAYVANQPHVTKVGHAGNRYTAHFSEPMVTTSWGFDYGPLGEANVLPITEVIGFSADSTAITFAVGLRPGEIQQVVLTRNFRSAKGGELRDYLLETGR